MIHRFIPEIEWLLVEIIEQEEDGLCTPEQFERLKHYSALRNEEYGDRLSQLGLILAHAIHDRNNLWFQTRDYQGVLDEFSDRIKRMSDRYEGQTNPPQFEWREGGGT
jgi:hypothetical protein